MSNKTWVVIGGWLISIIAAIIGTYSATGQEQNQNQAQSQEQSISININGEPVEINRDNAQELYDNLINELRAFSYDTYQQQLIL